MERTNFVNFVDMLKMQTIGAGKWVIQMPLHTLKKWKSMIGHRNETCQIGSVRFSDCVPVRIRFHPLLLQCLFESRKSRCHFFSQQEKLPVGSASNIHPFKGKKYPRKISISSEKTFIGSSPKMLFSQKNLIYSRSPSQSLEDRNCNYTKRSSND